MPWSIGRCSIGHSMGVQVALETYRRHAARVAGLVLVCGAPSHPLKTFRGSATLEDLLPTIQKWIHRVPGVINRVTRTLLPTRLAYEVASRLEIRRELVEPRRLHALPRGHGAHRCAAVRRDAVGRRPAHARTICSRRSTCPTLVVAGGRDGFTPPERSRAMAAAIPDAELLEIPNASHTAPIERPHLVDETIRDFVARRIDAADV